MSEFPPDPHLEQAEQYLQEIIAGLPQQARALRRREKIKKSFRWTVFGISLSFFVGWIAYSFTFLPPRISILGIEVGGLLPPLAYEKVLPEVTEQTNLPIFIESKDGEVEFSAETLGIKFSLPKTIQAAPKSPFAHLWSLIAPLSVEPKVEIDQEKFKSALAPIASELIFQPQNARLTTIDGVIQVYPHTTGKEIDWTRSLNNVKSSWLKKNSSVDLALVIIDPQITNEKIAVASEQVKQILANKLAISVVDKTVFFTSKELGNALKIIEFQDQIRISFNKNYLWGHLKQSFPDFNQPTTDAYFEIVDDLPVLIEGNVQIRITASELAKEFEIKLFDFENRNIDLTSYAVLPDLTTQSAESFNIVEKISEFRQPFPQAEYRAVNVGTAAKYLDGKILKPGEIFSMNDTIKQRTAENGYVTGIRIEGGRFIEDLGGGVSIITTAMWTAAFYAGLEPIEQRAHSIWIPRYQEGLEATVMWGSIDLKFKNTLDDEILIKTRVESDGVVVMFFGKKKYDEVVAEISNRYGVVPFKIIYSESQNCLVQEGQPGFGVNVTRKLVKLGIVVQEDTYKTNYRVGNQVVCGPKPLKEKSEEEAVVDNDLITAAD